ncbi:lipoprotein N-acyltransferase Lnb domain-containing protein [Reichenbachiella sp.]
MSFTYRLVFLVASCFILNPWQAKASDIQLSDEAEVIVLILDPTQVELYSAFGHSAFRVSDPANRIDLVFNYGIFDFDQPNFYLNFTKGKLYYKLGTGNYENYKRYYFREDRSWREHVLNINQADKQAIFDFLINNAKPENANYYYNYCYDNCATRMRDVIDLTLGDRIQYDYSYASDSLSFRDLMDKYLAYQPWGDLGIDICLGAEIDETADGFHYQYMPLYLEEALKTATLKTDSATVPVIASSEVINVSSEQPADGGFKPIHWFVIVFFVIGLITHRGLKYGVNYRFIDVILFGVTGLLGCFLLFLWFGTDHLSKYNFNLLWAMPLNLVAVFLLFKKSKPNGLRIYFMVFGGLQILLIIFRELLPQVIHFALIPFLLALALRSFYLAYLLKENKSID